MQKTQLKFKRSASLSSTANIKTSRSQDARPVFNRDSEKVSRRKKDTAAPALGIGEISLDGSA